MCLLARGLEKGVLQLEDPQCLWQLPGEVGRVAAPGNKRVQQCAGSQMGPRTSYLCAIPSRAHSLTLTHPRFSEM